MLTLAMLLALRRLFSQTKQGIDEIPSEHSESRRDAKRPRLKVKKKNLERIFRIERRLDVWEDVELAINSQAQPDDRKLCPLRQCASSTQTNAAAPQAATSMQTESVVVCSLAVQTQWIAMPITLQKLQVERPVQRDSSLQTELLGINISVQTETLAASRFPCHSDVSLQTEREQKSVDMQTEHRVFVYQTASMQTEPLEVSASAFKTKAVPESEEQKVGEVDYLQPVNLDVNFATVPTQTERVDRCDIALQTHLLGKSVSMQTDSRVLVLQTNWVQTEHPVKCDISVQTDVASEICEKVGTQEFATQADVIGQCDAASQIEFPGDDAGLRLLDNATQTETKSQCDESNQTKFVGNDVFVQTRRPSLPDLATQTDGTDSRDVALQTDVSGNVANEEFSTQTEEVLRRDAALQTLLVGLQSTEMQTERPKLPNLATQTDLIAICDTGFQTEFLGNNASVQTARPELPNLATQTDLIAICDTGFQTEFLGNDASVQTARPELPNLATQTDLIAICETGFQTEFLGNDAFVQTARPELPNLATQTDLITICDTGFQTEFLGNDISAQTERPSHTELSSQTENTDQCNISVQTEFNARAISVQTQSPELPAKSTQTTSTVNCDSCSQTVFDARSNSCQTEQRILPTFSMQTEKTARSEAGFQTDFVGSTVSTQTKPQKRPTFSMQTARVAKSDSAIQTEFERRNASIQTIKPLLPTFSMQTEKAVRLTRASQTDFIANDVSIQTEQTVPYLSLPSGVNEEPSLQCELGICVSRQSEVLKFPSSSTQTDLVVKSDSALQTEMAQKSVAIQTIKPKSPTFSVQTERMERHNRSSQTESVERCISLPNISIIKRNRSCQTDLLLDTNISTQTFLHRAQSSDSLEWTPLQSQMDSTNRSTVSEIEKFDLKRIMTTYSTCTAVEKAHYLGKLAEKMLKWYEIISFDRPDESHAHKIQTAEKALLEIEQDLRDCPQESGKRGVLVSAEERMIDYLQRLKTQRSNSLDIANKTL